MPDSKYSGMTTNERLFEADLWQAFDEAVRRRDRAAIIAVLDQVELENQSGHIADTILANPKFYGF
jgi:hypothetical protein